MRSVFRKGEPTIVGESSNSADANENVDACGDLFKAAKAGNVPKIRELLDANPEDVDNRCKACRNVTPVIVAAVSGQQRAVEELCNRGANVELRDIDGYTIIKLALDAGQRDIAEYLVCRYPDMTITDPRLPKGALWLEKEFWKMSNNISDKSSKPPKNVLDYLLTGDEKRYKPIKDRNVSEIYWEHILLRYIGDVPCDIRRNYSDELKMAFVGTFDRLLYKHCGIKESARLLNCVLPTTAYDVYGTHVASEQGWVTERWRYNDEKTKITVPDGIDTFLINPQEGKIVVMLINYRVYKDGVFLDNPDHCRLNRPCERV
ncbi:predicted protein [Aspergillus terreus NIH2624]|uniref:Uncharacterized protein n=1 Tax=Aspergillus terreus (strain NIH 2624 / FGSC A1156) TaxID=341663 RepID=Q0CJ92_ASPTN|nr:uncharacterized protein ATEG_06242 [Aspergillus terreus NIH2624]EAU32786.1 predicted protein [Aspergillus terreus NIH2624]